MKKPKNKEAKYNNVFMSYKPILNVTNITFRVYDVSKNKEDFKNMVISVTYSVL